VINVSEEPTKVSPSKFVLAFFLSYYKSILVISSLDIFKVNKSLAYQAVNISTEYIN
jgi:hypothetical protein